MKGILIVAGLSGMLIPALASAELDYNAVTAGFTSTMNGNNAANFTELSLGFTKSTSKNVYLGASYEAGRQPSTAIGVADKKVHSISLGAGFHTPLNDDVDAIVAGHIVQGSTITAGNNASANGYDIGAGVRAQFPNGLEGSITAVLASTSNGTYSTTDTYVNTQFGFDFTPEIQLYAGIDLFRDNQTMDFGMRFFF